MTNKDLPLVAIVGEPNVGKSTLLNKIAGGQFAVTSKVAGTTRDRQYLDTVFDGVAFSIVDTAGITFNLNDKLELKLNEQIEVALQEADVVLLVVDGKEGSNAVDLRALKKFRRLQKQKPVILVVNKLDSPKTEVTLAEFAKLGVKPYFGISSISGRGIGDLLEAVTVELRKAKLVRELPEKIPGIAVSIVGKPNVGKSSLFNNIIKNNRVVVSDVPGTTRTAIDTTIKLFGDTYTFIDTAGLKKKQHKQTQPDVFSVFQTFKSIRKSDICLLLVDSVETITVQDQRVASEILNMGIGVILVANKFDLFKGDEQKLRDYVSLHFPQLWYSPLFLVSAKTGEGVEELLKAIKPIYEARNKTTTQEDISALLSWALKQNPPKRLRDQKIPKVLGLKQLATNPPLFMLTVNEPAAISKQFRNFLQNAIIKRLNFWGTPITLKLEGKR